MIFTGSIGIDLVTFFIILTTTLFFYFKWSFQHWKNKKFNFLPPSIPRGNLLSPNIHLGVIFTDHYKEIRARNWKHAGLYTFTQPTYLPVDPEYIILVMVKDFQYFSDRGIYYNEKDDPISAHLLALGGPKWRQLRAKLTPTFTSGKMKMMFPILVECLAPLIETIEETMSSRSPIDIKQAIGSFTTNVIGSAAFGLDCQSFGEELSLFRKYGKRAFATNAGGMRIFQMTFPALCRKLGMRAIPKEISDFYMGVVKEAVEFRERTQKTRKDFLQLLIDLKNGHSDTSLTLEEISAQAFVFFLAGFETSSTIMTFALYALARDQEIQQRVREETRKVLEKHGKLTYEAIGEMKYLHQVLEETLRLYPPAPVVFRKCVEDYQHPFEEDLVIEKGTRVVIPIYGLHIDEEYFPEPHRFDPERFSEENKQNMVPYSYLPFGEGPRLCIGMRFGLMQAKVGLASLLKKFNFTLNKKTIEPIEFDAKSLVFSAKGDVWLNVQKL